MCQQQELQEANVDWAKQFNEIVQVDCGSTRVYDAAAVDDDGVGADPVDVCATAALLSQLG